MNSSKVINYPQTKGSKTTPANARQTEMYQLFSEMNDFTKKVVEASEKNAASSSSEDSCGMSESDDSSSCSEFIMEKMDEMSEFSHIQAVCPLKLAITKRNSNDKDVSASPKAEKVKSRHIVIDKAVFGSAYIIKPNVEVGMDNTTSD